MPILQDFEPNVYNLTGQTTRFKQGVDDRKRVQIERTLPSGEKVPVNLTGVTALAIECRGPGTTDSTTNCPQPSASVITAIDGIIEIYMPRTQTQKGLSGSKDQTVGTIVRDGRYDVEATDGTNKVRLVAGDWKLDEEIAR